MYTKPWSLVLSEFDNRTTSDWPRDALEIKRIIGVQPFQETGEEHDEPMYVFARFICHLLIERIPDQGLPDVCQSMVEFFEFYSQTPSSRLILRAPEHRVAGVVREVREPARFKISGD